MQARGNADYLHDRLRQKFYASTAPALCGLNGRYIEMDFEENLLYGDIMAMIRKEWGDFSLNAAIGTGRPPWHIPNMKHQASFTPQSEFLCL